MTRRLMTAMFFAVFAMSGIAQAKADQCAARTDMVRALGEKFHENQAARGLVNPNVVLEIFISDQGTWTILATDTHGQSCVITAGEGWDGGAVAVALPGA